MTGKELRVFGFGGQGIITLGRLVGEAGIIDKKEVIMTEEYSPYITGGWSRADLILSDEKIDYPMLTGIDYLISLSQEGLDSNVAHLNRDSMVFIESTMVNSAESGVQKVFEIDARKIAESLGSSKLTNIVMLGFFNAISEIVSMDSIKQALKKRFPKFEKMNMEALEIGYKEGVIYA